MAQTRFAWADIDLGAIAHNVRALKERTGRGTLFMAVVKADGYGHGAVPVARAAVAAGADRLGVATLDEAVQLREAEFAVPVQLLSEPPRAAIAPILDRNVIPAVATREFVMTLAQEASTRGIDAPYHLKVDTGMNRTGVRAEEAAAFAASLKGVPGLRLEGTFTHFATADTPGDWDFGRQLERFESTLAEMRTEGVDPGIVHSANSAATILHPETHQGMVRCGIAMYGLHPAHSTYARVELRPAMAIRARITFLKRIQMGEGVSYGLTWRAAAPTLIATLPLGYGDGVHRLLSNRMEVLLAGRRCAQVGRVCMDQLMVEVASGMQVSLGDEAVLVGTQGSETVLMDQLAERAETINYELACAFGARLPRFYVQE